MSLKNHKSSCEWGVKKLPIFYGSPNGWVPDNFLCTVVARRFEKWMKGKNGFLVSIVPIFNAMYKNKPRVFALIMGVWNYSWLFPEIVFLTSLKHVKNYFATFSVVLCDISLDEHVSTFSENLWNELVLQGTYICTTLNSETSASK